MNTLKLTLLLIAALILQACASSNKLASCPSPDWNVIGYEDGKLGNTPYSARSFRKSCNNISTPYDDEAYTSGLQRGAREYCTPPNGYILGRSGAEYKNLCAEDLKDAFVKEYKLGSDHFEIDATANELRRELLAAKQDRRRTKNHLENTRSPGTNAGIGTNQYQNNERKMLDHIAYLDKHIKYLSEEIKKIENKIEPPPYYEG